MIPIEHIVVSDGDDGEHHEHEYDDEYEHDDGYDYGE